MICVNLYREVSTAQMRMRYLWHTATAKLAAAPTAMAMLTVASLTLAILAVMPTDIVTPDGNVSN